MRAYVKQRKEEQFTAKQAFSQSRGRGCVVGRGSLNHIHRRAPASTPEGESTALELVNTGVHPG
jgi:hypothetical protein